MITFVVCFFILTNYRLEKKKKEKKKIICKVESLNVKQRISRWAVSSGSMLFAKAYYYRLWQWKS